MPVIFSPNELYAPSTRRPTGMNGGMDLQRRGAVVSELRRIGQVAHGPGNAACDSNRKRLDEAELRVRNARSSNEGDRGDREVGAGPLPLRALHQPRQRRGTIGERLIAFEGGED